MLLIDWVGDDVVVVVSDDVVVVVSDDVMVVVSDEVDSVVFDPVEVVDSDWTLLVSFTSTAKKMSAVLGAGIVRRAHFDTAC